MGMREKIIELLMQKGFGVEGATLASDHLIANGVTIQKWIPVTERLPEMHEAVLVYTLTHDVLKAHFRGERSFFGHDGIWRCVTHWMPLPEPPKGE